MKILLAQINPIVGDLKGNTEKILQYIEKGREKKADIVLFPELALTGYPPEDFLLLSDFIDAVNLQLQTIINASKNIAVIVGTPRKNPDETEKFLYNSAAIIYDGKLIGFRDKSLLPTYDVFDERRYFEPAKENNIWEFKGKRVAITICEDIWQHSSLLRETDYRYDPIKDFQKQKPDLVLNLSASPFNLAKFVERSKVCAAAASSLNCPFVLCNQVGGNDSLIFDGYSFYYNNRGELISYAKGFEEDALLINLDEKRSPAPLLIDETENLHKALVLGVRDYFSKLGFKKACLGISGGIDSAVVAAIAVNALGKENVLGVMMPSRFTSNESKTDAALLAKNLGIHLLEISIEKPFESFLGLLEPLFEGKPFDSTEENIQSRIRGMILMAISNKHGHIVLSTGNKSELAMGYATLYGDMVGGLGVINDVTKNQVYALAHWINHKGEIIPQRTVTRAPSAELRPNQKDSDSLPDYEIVDNVVREYVEEHHSAKEISQKFGYPLKLVNDLVQRIHRNEYKRRQSPPGLRVSQKAFSIGRRFPIVQRWI